MNLKRSISKFTFSLREFMPAITVTSGTLAWFFVFQLNINSIFKSIITDTSWILTAQFLFYSAGIISAIIGSLISKKINNRRFLLSWIIVGLLSMLSLVFFGGLAFALIVSVFLGVSFGLGLPTSMAWVANSVAIDKRGRVAGITILITFIMAFITLGLYRVIGGGIITLVVLAAVIRSVSCLGFIKTENPIDTKKAKTDFSKSQLREFSFYIIPWLIFTISSGLAWNLVPDLPEYTFYINLGYVVRFILIAFFGFVWGIVADRKGRKGPVVIGLVLLGISYFLLGFVESPYSVLAYLSLAGVAWGSFFTMYLIIPGDLSIPVEREKFYAIGTILPIVILFSLGMIPENLSVFFSENAFSQILSLLLFLSIIPIIRAKETLPKQEMRRRELEDYTDKLGRVIQESEEET
jgi:MFS family permease